MTTSAKVKEIAEADASSKTKAVPKLKSVANEKKDVGAKIEKTPKSKVAKVKSKTNLEVDPVTKPEQKAEAKKPAAEKATVPEQAKDKKVAQPKMKAQAKRAPRKRLTKSERIESQSNPRSMLVGSQKTLTLRYEYCSDILHEYLQMNQATMLAAYERLAGLLRLVATDKQSYTHVNDWITTNLAISQEQVLNMQQRRTTLAEDCSDEIDNLNINVPDNYHTEFQVSHPVCHKMLAVLRLIDTELNASEDLFMAGIIDDASYMALKTEATSVVRGSVDRIYKATSPGTREGGRYTPAQLASWIRSGNKMLFVDVPKDVLHLVDQKDS